MTPAPIHLIKARMKNQPSDKYISPRSKKKEEEHRCVCSACKTVQIAIAVDATIPNIWCVMNAPVSGR